MNEVMDAIIAPTVDELRARGSSFAVCSTPA